MWVAVNKHKVEIAFHCKPVRVDEFWVDEDTYDEIRKLTTDADDYSIVLPKGSIQKLIGRELTWDDDPVELPLNY